MTEELSENLAENRDTILSLFRELCAAYLVDFDDLSSEEQASIAKDVLSTEYFQHDRLPPERVPSFHWKCHSYQSILGTHDTNVERIEQAPELVRACQMVDVLNEYLFRRRGIFQTVRRLKKMLPQVTSHLWDWRFFLADVRSTFRRNISRSVTQLYMGFIKQLNSELRTRQLVIFHAEGRLHGLDVVEHFALGSIIEKSTCRFEDGIAIDVIVIEKIYPTTLTTPWLGYWNPNYDHALINLTAIDLSSEGFWFLSKNILPKIPTNILKKALLIKFMSSWRYAKGCSELFARPEDVKKITRQHAIREEVRHGCSRKRIDVVLFEDSGQHKTAMQRMLREENTLLECIERAACSLKLQPSDRERYSVVSEIDGTFTAAATSADPRIELVEWSSVLFQVRAEIRRRNASATHTLSPQALEAVVVATLLMRERSVPIPESLGDVMPMLDFLMEFMKETFPTIRLTFKSAYERQFWWRIDEPPFHAIGLDGMLTPPPNQPKILGLA